MNNIPPDATDRFLDGWNARVNGDSCMKLPRWTKNNVQFLLGWHEAQKQFLLSGLSDGPSEPTLVEKK